MQRDTTYGSVFENVTFTGQSSTAIRFTMQGQGDEPYYGRVQVTNCLFDNIPTAMQFESLSANRIDEVYVDDSTILGGQVGMSLRAAVGGDLAVYLDRNRVENTTSAFSITRTGPGADRVIRVQATHTAPRASRRRSSSKGIRRAGRRS